MPVWLELLEESGVNLAQTQADRSRHRRTAAHSLFAMHDDRTDVGNVLEDESPDGLRVPGGHDPDLPRQGEILDRLGIMEPEAEDSSAQSRLSDTWFLRPGIGD